jgi:hypothetical protein
VQAISIRYESGKPVIIADFPELATAKRWRLRKRLRSTRPVKRFMLDNNRQNQLSAADVGCLTGRDNDTQFRFLPTGRGQQRREPPAFFGGAEFFCIYLYFFNSN